MRKLQRFAAGVEYNGAGYNGWQRQPHSPSVQQHVEYALSQVAAHSVMVTAAGRTDTGVHATGQVIHFDSSAPRTPYQWLRGANTYLPPTVRLVWVTPVQASFSARFSARVRHYRYIILNRPVAPGVLSGLVSWHPTPLDVTRMRDAAAPLIGEHDFSAFRAMSCQSKSPVREVYRLDVGADAPWLWVDVSANGFLHHMVRNIVGSLIAVAGGTREPDWITQVLSGADRRQAGMTASASGLYLYAVEYSPADALPAAPPAPRFW